jgi:hypothetical protein
MYDFFDRWFYEWWAGLSRPSRVITAVLILAGAGVTAWVLPAWWLFWVPALVAGSVLLLFS